LLDSDRCYWTKVEYCDENGSVQHCVICDDFQPIQSVLVPHKLSFQSGNFHGVLEDYLTLELIEAKINDVEFSDRFFENPDPSMVKEVVHMKR